MRALRISQEIVPVSDFKAQAADWLRRVADSGQPLVITQNGKAAGVLLSPARFDELTEQARFVQIEGTTASCARVIAPCHQGAPPVRSPSS
jgi:prevent-host-death family protein